MAEIIYRMAPKAGVKGLNLQQYQEYPEWLAPHSDQKLVARINGEVIKFVKPGRGIDPEDHITKEWHAFNVLQASPIGSYLVPITGIVFTENAFGEGIFDGYRQPYEDIVPTSEFFYTCPRELYPPLSEIAEFHERLKSMVLDESHPCPSEHMWHPENINFNTEGKIRLPEFELNDDVLQDRGYLAFSLDSTFRKHIYRFYEKEKI